MRGFYDVLVSSQAVDKPDEPRLEYGNLVGRLKTPFPGLGPLIHRLAYQDGEVVGVAAVHFPEAENSELAVVEITVHPRFRRRGVGTAMLRSLLPELRARGRVRVEGGQVTKDGAGERWANVLGFQVANTRVMQVLLVPEVDSAIWEVEAPSGYHLERWVGSAPERLVESYAVARQAIHDAPLGGAEFQDPEWTIERVRAAENELRALGIEQRVVVAVHDQMRAVAGFTEVELHPHRPFWGYQRDTAVLSAHRGHGLGRFVKAGMMRWLLADRPGLERVYTGTSADNSHMINVNHQLGYTTVRTMIVVNSAVSSLEAFLTSG